MGLGVAGLPLPSSPITALGSYARLCSSGMAGAAHATHAARPVDCTVLLVPPAGEVVVALQREVWAWNDEACLRASLPRVFGSRNTSGGSSGGSSSSGQCPLLAAAGRILILRIFAHQGCYGTCLAMAQEPGPQCLRNGCTLLHCCCTAALMCILKCTADEPGTCPCTCMRLHASMRSQYAIHVTHISFHY